MKKKQIVRDMWIGFAEKVIPRDAPDVQRVDMESSFYAGFLSALEHLVTPSNEKSEQETVDDWEAVYVEVFGFFEDIAKAERKIKMQTSHVRGWPVSYDDDDGKWRWSDTGSEVDDKRPCVRCGRPPTSEGHDACIGNIDGVEAACCGHGVTPPYRREFKQ